MLRRGQRIILRNENLGASGQPASGLELNGENGEQELPQPPPIGGNVLPEGDNLLIRRASGAGGLLEGQEELQSAVREEIAQSASGELVVGGQTRGH